MNPTINVALLGFGLAGRVFHAPLVATTPGLALHTVVSSDPAKVLAAYPHVRVVANPARVFTDPEIGLVVVATPNHTHAPLAMAALAAGKHVVVDKPFALDVEQGLAMATAAARGGRVLSVFHNRRWDADFLALRAVLDSGELGEVAEVHSHFDRFRPLVPDRWRDRPGPGSGLWYDLGPHLADQALQLFGPPLAVSADLAAQREGATATDYFHVQLHYPRLRVHLHAGSLVAVAAPRFSVHGSTGSWIKHGLDPQEDALRAGLSPGGPDWGLDPSPGTLLAVQADGCLAERPSPTPQGDYPAYYARLRDAITLGSPPPVEVRDALATMQLIGTGIASSTQRRELPFVLP